MKIFIFIILLFSWQIIKIKCDTGVLQIVRSLLTENVAGTPVIHEETEWDFHPETGYKQRNLFYERNGYRAMKYIESIGVGLDGKDEERRINQAMRDQGRLNGEHYINFP